MAGWLLVGAIACEGEAPVRGAASTPSLVPEARVGESSAPVVEEPATTPTPTEEEERLAVVLRSNVPRDAVERVVGEAGAVLAADHEREQIYWLRIDAPEPERAAIVERLRAAPDVEVVTADPEGHFERWRMQKPPFRASE